MTPALHHLLVGPPRHGVTRYAELLVAALDVPEHRVVRVERRVGRADLPVLLDRLPAGAPVHTHVTDHLFGSSPEEAADVLLALAAGRRLAVTLHDLPQASDGAPWARRRACYAAVARFASTVVLSSEHERDLLHAAMTAADGADASEALREVDLRVVPLATARSVPALGDGSAAPSSGRDVAVLGFVYPGKGHAEVLEALDGLPDDVGLRVLGEASPGHDDLVRDLQRRGEALRRRVHVDGWVDDADLDGLLRQVAVPVHAPRHVSASASLTAWAAAGRRPVATRSRYAEEVERRAPGSLLLVEDDPQSLALGVREALADPGLTRTGAVTPTTDPVRSAEATFAELAG